MRTLAVDVCDVVRIVYTQGFSRKQAMKIPTRTNTDTPKSQVLVSLRMIQKQSFSSAKVIISLVKCLATHTCPQAMQNIFGHTTRCIKPQFPISSGFRIQFSYDVHVKQYWMANLGLHSMECVGIFANVAETPRT